MGRAMSPAHPSLLKTTYKIMLFLIFSILLGAALALPFLYQTETLWYKTGIDKILLRTGQQAGLAAFVLLLAQIVLSLRGRFFENLFGNAVLIRWHRTNGPVVACLACCHVLLILAPEGLGNIPFGKRYWPEMTGEGLFVLIVITVILSQFRSPLKLDYKKWSALHRPLGYMIPVLALIHALYVSDSFSQGAPRTVLLALFAVLSLYAVLVKAGRGKTNA